jgi:general secretion pathway protein G
MSSWPKFLVLALILCASSCSRVGKDSNISFTATQISIFRTALDAFQVDTGRFPSTEEGLVPLIIRPNDIPEQRWRGPYLLIDKIPEDVWGHKYVYHFPGKHHMNGYDIYSLGPDGVSKSGGEDPDDIANWQTRSASAGAPRSAKAKTISGMELVSLLLPIMVVSAYVTSVACRVARRRQRRPGWLLLVLSSMVTAGVIVGVGCVAILLGPWSVPRIGGLRSWSNIALTLFAYSSFLALFPAFVILLIYRKKVSTDGSVV